MLPDLAVGRNSALPETLSHTHLQRLLRYVPGMCGSGVCCWLVGQSVWLLACHTSLSIAFLWLCHCPQQFPLGSDMAAASPGKAGASHRAGGTWHAWAQSRALSTPGLVLTTAWPAPMCPLLSPPVCPPQSCPRPGQARQGLPCPSRHCLPGREGGRRPSGRFRGAASASGVLLRGEGGWGAPPCQAAAIQNTLSSRKKPECL